MRNRSPYIAALLAALSVASLTYGQVEDPKEVSKDVARDIQKLFVSEYKSKDAKHRHGAVDRLSPFKHELIVKCLARAMVDADSSVRVAAALRLGKQAAKPALKVLSKAFSDRRNAKSPEVLVSILQAYGAHRRSPPMKQMKSLFAKAPKEVQRELVVTLRYLRSTDTVRFLAQHVDMPQPQNVDAGSNPPASYWKDKIERWGYCFSAITETLVHLTGREFDSNTEVRGWLKSSTRILSVEEGDEALKAL